jgi:DNA-directed RNA polymerase subunit M/transcription elongation factor TFIIS
MNFNKFKETDFNKISKCPKCGSQLYNIVQEQDAGGGRVWNYTCDKCRFQGYIQWDYVYGGHFDINGLKV